MSDKGYISDRIENAIAKLLDDKIDFSEKRKVLGLIDMEKKDRKIFKLAISFIDDKCIGKNPNIKVKAEIDLVLSFIEKGDVNGFDNHVADILERKINVNLGEYERQIYLGFLMLCNGFIGTLFNKVNKLIAEGNTEA